MKTKNYQQIFRKIIFFLWLLIVISAFAFYFSKNISLREYPKLIENFLKKQTFWAPFFYLLLHAFRPFLFFPTAILEGMAGLLFGVWKGFLLNYIGVNLSSNIAFFVARTLGHRFVKKTETGKLKEFDKKIEENGFLAIFLMRMAYLPFDLVNYTAGLSFVRFKDYFFATLFSTLVISSPIVILGSSIRHPVHLYYVGGFLLFSIITFILARKAKK